MTKRILEDLRTSNEELARMMAEYEATRAQEAAAQLEREDAEVDAEIDADIARGRSVVGRKYKLRYKQRAREAGLRGKKSKAAKRSSWDWLAQQLAGECLDKQSKIDIAKFTAILDANDVDHSRWTNRSPGWEGRFRMTGRLALQREVAETGILRLPDGETLEAPAEWLAKYNNE
jgi:hypothetical protein